MRRKFSLLMILMAMISGCSYSSTNDIYLIPAGYEGYVLAVYNVKGAPALNYEGDFAIHDINESGYFVTSQSDLDYGTVTDQYFYMDEKGKRSELNAECIRGIGTGGHERTGKQGEMIKLVYSGIEITSNCSEDFPLSANGMDSEETEPMINEIIQNFYYESK